MILMKEKILSSLILTFLLFSVLAVSLQQPAFAWEAKVKSFVACRDVDTTQKPPVPIGVADSFSTTDERIYFFLLLVDVKGPVTTSFKVFDPGGKLFVQVNFEPKTENYEWLAYWPYANVAGMINAFGEWRVEAHINKQLIATLKFTLSPPTPKIEVVSKIQVPSENEPLYLGNVLTIRITLKNGGALAKEVSVRFEDVAPAEGLTVFETTPARDLKTGETAEWTIKVRADKPGRYSAVLRVYVAGEKVTEGPWDIPVSLPELELVEKKASPSQEEPFYVGDVATLTYKIKNVGKGVAKDIKVSVELPEGLTLVEVTEAKDLDPGATGEWILRIKAEKQGEYKGKTVFSSMGTKISESELTVKVTQKFPFDLALLGIIAIVVIANIAVLVAKRRKKKPSPAATPTRAEAYAPPPTETQKFCVNCGAPLPADAQFCGKCGSRQ